jgi:hypothetical protein
VSLIFLLSSYWTCSLMITGVFDAVDHVPYLVFCSLVKCLRISASNQGQLQSANRMTLIKSYDFTQNFLKPHTPFFPVSPCQKMNVIFFFLGSLSPQCQCRWRVLCTLHCIFKCIYFMWVLCCKKEFGTEIPTSTQCFRWILNQIPPMFCRLR